MCAVAVTLAGCSGASKKTDTVTRTSQKKLLKAEQAKLAKSERARKTAVRKLAVALTANKAKDKKLRAAQRATKKYRTELQAADRDIADLETRLAEAKASQVNTGEEQSVPQQSAQLIESLKAELDKSRKQRDVLNAQLEKAQQDTAAPASETLAANSHGEQAAKQRIALSGTPTESVESEKRVLKRNCERALHQAATLDKELMQSRAKSEKLKEKLLVSLDKMESISKQHTRERQVAAKQAEILHQQLEKAKRQIAEHGGSKTGSQCNDR